jgi:hypothetical protein
MVESEGRFILGIVVNYFTINNKKFTGVSREIFGEIKSQFGYLPLASSLRNYYVPQVYEEN